MVRELRHRVKRRIPRRCVLEFSLSWRPESSGRFCFGVRELAPAFEE
jgi:hypothetical protein